MIRNFQIAILAASIAVSCSASDSADGVGPEPVARPERTFVEQLVPRFAELARQRIESVAVASSLDARLAASAARPWGERLDGGIKYADLLHAEYAATGWTLAFAGRDGLTNRGAGVVSRLQAADVDALDNALYHLDEIETQGATLAAAPKAPKVSFALDAVDAELAVTWVEEHREMEEGTRTRALIDALLGLGDEPPLSERLAGQQRAYREATAPLRGSIVELEVRVADGALRFARDMRHFNYKRMSWAELERRGGGKAVVYDRLRGTLAALAGAEDAAGADEVLVDLRPSFEQYDRLVDALARYRSLEPWGEIAPFDISSGTPAQMTALRDRLSTEGFTDAELGAAVHAYQIAHQFVPGMPTAGFWRSLNVTLEHRIREIELTIQRYRESFYRDEPDFVFVNIPDFHAEVFHDGELQRRIPVVVGNTERVCDPETGRWRFPNATPVQWAELDHLMLNPWWNVPPRLFREEIEPHLDDPAWLDQKNFELFTTNGVTQARQRPGPTNALGLVKFIFPNPHNTYMHDTPQKQYFELPVRTFSHGCVRVKDPLELAEYFMTTYDLGGKSRLDHIMELGSTIKIELPPHIPVFFEYYTVRVSDDGRTEFLADPYDLDQERLDPDDETLFCIGTDASDVEEPSVQNDEPLPGGLADDHGP